MKIVFAGGGSGGHVYPLIAVADEVRRLDPSAQCEFISTRGSIEEKLVPRAGYPLKLIPSGKLKSQGLLKTLKTLLALPLSFLICAWLVLRARPSKVFSAGGYAGAPYILVASLFGVPCFILEQNRVPGMANSLMAKFCRKIYLNFEASKECFRGKDLKVVGHPCRKEIESARWREAEVKSNFTRQPFRIFVFGGSQGAVGINRLVAAALPELKSLDVEILHQTGQLDYERVKRDYADAGFTKARVETYVYEMAKAYNEAHLVICRAGASSLAELAAAGKAAVLIPLVSKDKHQEHNAAAVAELGACETYLQPSLDGQKLASILKRLYTERERLENYAAAMARMHHPGAAEAIAEDLLGKV